MGLCKKLAENTLIPMGLLTRAINKKNMNSTKQRKKSKSNQYVHHASTTLKLK
jgi:hypothetical protein